MNRRGRRSRRGITLTEILISILIIGIGMSSLMTLFLYGLVNARQADRYARSAYLVHSAGSDITTRGVLNKASFKSHVSGVYYYDSTFTPWPYDPWLQDTPGYDTAKGKWLDPISGANGYGAYRGNGSFNTKNDPPHDKPAPFDYVMGTGLPVAYDPLWRTAANYFPGAANEARFASGIGWVRNDPNPGTGAAASTLPSAHGLQRITNFPNYPTASKINVPDIFVSPEDVVLQSATDASKGAGTFSPIVPDLAMGGLSAATNLPTVTNDWKYTWMFTGYQTTSDNISAFEGDMVIFENRPFAIDSATPPIGGDATMAVAGETVVEAIFGYTGRVTAPAGSSLGYGTNAGKGVLLRWPSTMPDPEIKVGGWIADVTYERNAAVDYKRSVSDPDSGNAGTRYPYQRCYWYLIAKRTQPGPGQKFAGDPTGVAYREMTVWTSTPLKAFTMLNVSDGSPCHVNAALVSPYVVNVYPRTFVSR